MKADIELLEASQTNLAARHQFGSRLISWPCQATSFSVTVRIRSGRPAVARSICSSENCAAFGAHQFGQVHIDDPANAVGPAVPSSPQVVVDRHPPVCKHQGWRWSGPEIMRRIYLPYLDVRQSATHSDRTGPRQLGRPLRPFLTYLGRKTVGSKKRKMTATITAAIARMNAPVTNLTHMVRC